MTERSIFIAALDRSSPEEREAFVAHACGPDAALRRRVEQLLCSHVHAGGFMTSPAPEQQLPPGSYAPPVVEGPGSRIGPYKLLERLGEGGMGVVFMSEQEAPVRRRVALKIIKPGMDSAQVVARFEAERQALALMDHVNIARVLDVGTTAAGRPYFVMELVHGTPITEYCAANRLPLEGRLRLFVAVCNAIQHAHQKGIIHRDIKPSNVLVTLYDGKPVPKVIDFGVAKAVEQRLTERTLFTRYGTLVGTFEYMAPEQVEMNALGVDTRSDVFSLGVMLYELLTGTTPIEREQFRVATFEEALRLIREVEPQPPSLRLGTSTRATPEARPEDGREGAEARRLTRLVRGELDWVVLKCLEKDRTRRYATADALARDVESYLENRPVAANPPSLGYKLRKFARRNRALLAGTGVVVAAILAGSGLAAAGFVKARGERDRAVLAQAAEARQRTEAERSRATAVRQAARADAVGRFLRDMFGGGRAKVIPANTTIRQLLDAAAERLERDPAANQDPTVKAAIYDALGRGYIGIGLAAAAEPHIRVGLDIRERELGPNHPEVAQSLASLAGLYGARGMHAEAEMCQRRGLEIQRRVSGEGSAVVADHLQLLALIVSSLGRHDEAQKILEQSTAIQRRLFDENSDQLVAARNAGAMIQLARGEYADAEQGLRELLTGYRALDGGESQQLATCLYNLGVALARQKKDGAEDVWRECMAIRKRVLGEDHPEHIKALQGLIYHLTQVKKDSAAAEPLVRERNRLLLTQADQNLALRPGDPVLLRRLAGIRVRRAEFAAAAADLERSLQSAGDNHWHWYACAALYLYAGDDADYRRVALQAYRRFEQDPQLFVRERCAKLCLLAPDPVLPPGELALVLDRFVEENREPIHFGWSKLSRALCDYRAGRYPSAAQWLERSREHAPFNRLAEATYLLLRAMTRQRLDEPAAARSDLDAARGLIERDLAEPTENDLDGCGDVLPLRVLLKEAETLLAGKAPR